MATPLGVSLGAGQIKASEKLDLEPGIHVIAFGVRDEATQEASFVATGIEIQQPPETAGNGR